MYGDVQSFEMRISFSFDMIIHFIFNDFGKGSELPEFRKTMLLIELVPSGETSL